MNISPGAARLELALLDSKAQVLDKLDVFTHLTNLGLPPELILRLEELWENSKVVGKKIVHIGKILVLEIMRFIGENSNLATGLALGAAVGALVSLIPFLGPVLAPLTMTIGAAFGSVVGSRLDRSQNPEKGAVGIFQEVILIAKKFFELLAAVFIALKDDLSNSNTHI